MDLKEWKRLFNHMSPDEFTALIISMFDECKNRLALKDQEYAGGFDVFEAFRIAAKAEDVPPAEIARRYRLKHDVSVIKMIKDVARGKYLDNKFIDEKFGDIICYTVLMYGMVREMNECNQENSS